LLFALIFRPFVCGGKMSLSSSSFDEQTFPHCQNSGKGVALLYIKGIITFHEVATREKVVRGQNGNL